MAVAVTDSVTQMAVSGVDSDRARLGDLEVFRREFHGCLTARADALFELTDAVLCTEGPVTTLVGLSLAPEHQRGHGSLYDGLNQGRIDVDRFRNVVVGLPIPRCAGGRIVLGVDISNWLRPDAPTSPDRLFCHTYGRGRNQAQMIPGWPYSVVAALQQGRSSWCAVLDAQRLGPGDDETTVTATQLRAVVERIIEVGHWVSGDPQIWIVGDSGYDGPRLAFLLADLPVQLLVRVRSDRVLCSPVPPREPTGAGRPARHGPEVRFADPRTWPEPTHTTTTQTTRYGTAVARAFDRLHPRLTRRGAWADHDGDLPIIEGTVVRLQVDHLPGEGQPKPLWLWWSATSATIVEVDQLWQTYLRRFDLEHTFRFFKQTLGWTRAKTRSPEAGDRWTQIIIATHTQLRLSRHLTHDLRRPWERPTEPDQLTPARTRRGFRNIHSKLPQLVSAPKPSRPGPGRPPGSPNAHRAPRHEPGKKIKTATARGTKRQPG